MWNDVASGRVYGELGTLDGSVLASVDFLPVTNLSSQTPIVRLEFATEEYAWQYVDNVTLLSPPAVVTVTIDIKPGSYPNPINMGSHGVTPVAIVSTVDFDATTVNPETVSLAGAGVAVRLVGATWKVVNSMKSGNGGGNGEGEWRGRVEQILDTVVKVQDHSVAELAELRRASERLTDCTQSNGEMLERVANLLDAHDRRTAEAAAVIPAMARQVDALHQREFAR